MYFFSIFQFKNQLLRSIHLLQKPFYCSLIIPLLMHNKNRFSSDCTLPRSSALLLSYVLAGPHGSHTAHTRLTHGSHTAPTYALFRQAPAQNRLHTARLSTLTASGLNGSVRLYAITYNKRWRYTYFYVLKHLCFYVNISTAFGIVKVMFNPLKTM